MGLQETALNPLDLSSTATIGGAPGDVKEWQRTGEIGDMRECPLCGESMRLSVRDVQEKNGAIRQVREWICPSVRYFEEADGEG